MAYLKFKACRRLGAPARHNNKLTPKQNTIIKLVIKKNTSRKQSDFSKKLQQLKKLAYFYGMRSLNNRVTSNTALSSRLDKKKSLLLTLETRLDVLLVRLHFCSTLFAARQLITHNKIRVNLNVVNLPGFTVRNGDIISMSRKGPVCATARLRLVARLRGKIKALCVSRLSGRAASAHWCVSSQPAGSRASGALANRQNMISVRRGPTKVRFGSGQPGSRTQVPGPFVAIRERPFTGVGGLYHFEVNYKTFNAVLLYEPIQVHFPYKIDLDLLF